MSVAARGVDALITFTEVAEAAAAQEGASLKTQFAIPGAIFGLFHDFAVTERYYVLYENPLRPNLNTAAASLGDMLTGKRTLASTFDNRQDLPCKIHLIPRPGSGVTPRSFAVPKASHAVHHVNAFELNGGRHIVLDSIAYRNIELRASLGSLGAEHFTSDNRAELTRFVVNTETRNVTQRVLSHRTCDFPVINKSHTGRPHSCIFAPAAAVEDAVQWGPNQTIIKLSVPTDVASEMAGSGGYEVWSPGDLCFTQVRGVPCPRGEEESGNSCRRSLHAGVHVCPAALGAQRGRRVAADHGLLRQEPDVQPSHPRRPGHQSRPSLHHHAAALPAAGCGRGGGES